MHMISNHRIVSYLHIYTYIYIYRYYNECTRWLSARNEKQFCGTCGIIYTRYLHGPSCCRSSSGALSISQTRNPKLLTLKPQTLSLFESLTPKPIWTQRAYKQEMLRIHTQSFLPSLKSSWNKQRQRPHLQYPKVHGVENSTAIFD